MTGQHFSASKVPPGLGAGARLAGYLLEEQIGEGGMAVVYRAHEDRLGRTVALKVLAPALASDAQFRQRFMRESRAAAAVDHPHIIPVYEAGDADGVLFIAMRFVRGGDVKSLLATHGLLPIDRVLGIVAQAASALDTAHGHGLVHRDVKPANMLLDRANDADPGSDHLYLSDFGLSKAAAAHTSGLTATGMFLGTLDYVSPEQIEGVLVDGRADQYSLACTAYEMLSGTPPFRRDDAMALMYAQVFAPPPPLTARRPGLPAAVDEALARALAKSPADRYGSCMQFCDALRNALGASLEGATTATSVRPPQPAARLWPADRPPTEVVASAAAAAGTPPHGKPPAQPAQPARPRRIPGQALLIGACILAAAGVVSGAILFRSPGKGKPAASGSPSPHHATSQGAASPQARSSSPLPTTGGQHNARAPGTAGYQLAARLNPGPSTTSISGVAWDANGPLIAASDKNGNTYLWNAATQARYGPALPGPGTAYYTAFSPDGSIVATGYSNGSTYLWSTATGKRLARLHDPGSQAGKEVNSLAFSPDGRTLATADGNGYTDLWNVASPGTGVTRIASLRDPNGTGVWSVTFGSGGTLATGDYYGGVFLWDVASLTRTATFSVPGGGCGNASTVCDAVSGLAFNGDGSVLAAASINGNAELWSVPGRHAAPLPNVGCPVIWGLAFGGNRTLGVACGNGRLNIWRVNPGGPTASLAGAVMDPRHGRLGIGAVTLSADGSYLVAGDTNGSVYLWKTGSSGSPQAWASGELVITPRSLGPVTVGMTTGQASAAAGEKLVTVGDGVLYPGGSTTSGLSVAANSGNQTVSCVSAVDQPGTPAVVTPQGFRLGETLAKLKAVYGGRLRYVPAPAGGITPLPGYVVAFGDGNLVFWVGNGKVVDHIAGGPGVLPSTNCV